MLMGNLTDIIEYQDRRTITLTNIPSVLIAGNSETKII